MAHQLADTAAAGASVGPAGTAGSIGYVCGALANHGNGAPGGLRRTVNPLSTPPKQHFGLGGIHVISVPLSTAAGWGIAAAKGASGRAFLAAGFNASVAYQLLLGLEVSLT